MQTKFKTQLQKDLPNKKIKVTREFDAPVELVWKTWTESEFLDQWWAPKPWMAKTKSMKFKEGGNWLYAMKGPDGTEMWNIVEFSSVKKNQYFNAISFFCDAIGNKNDDFPSMSWNNVFIPTESGAKIEIELSFQKEKDFETILNMGFESGFTSALENLDELLSKA